MPKRWSPQINHCPALLLIGIVLSLVVTCGPTPTPQVVIVTNTPTPEPVVLVVTATFTPTSVPTDTPLPTATATATATATPEPTDTPLPTATAAPTEEPLTFVSYQHPSGAFRLDIPQNASYSEDGLGMYLTYKDSLLMVFYAFIGYPLDAAALENMIPDLIESSLIGEGLITTYDNLTTDSDEASSMAGARFAITSDRFGDGEGSIILWRVGETLHFMFLLTPDYAAVQQVWETAFDTWTVTPVEPSPTPVPPTNTPRPPTATPKPKPQPTNTPKPTSPPPPTSKKGCYLFQNYIDAELTITFTARDRPWSDSFKIGANATKEYCLDPGRYTYTIDAPPPWGSVNGELEVHAGDYYSWPIRGR